MSSTAPAIAVDGLRKSYGTFDAVKGISFEVSPGETFGFLGPNGAGKSTTISMLCTLIRPSSGRATVDGFDVVDPGLVFIPQWRPDDPADVPADAQTYGNLVGIGRKPEKDHAARSLDLDAVRFERAQQGRRTRERKREFLGFRAPGRVNRARVGNRESSGGELLGASVGTVPDRRPAVLPPLVDDVVVDVEVRLSALVAVVFRAVDDALQGRQSRLFG